MDKETKQELLILVLSFFIGAVLGIGMIWIVGKII